MLRNYIITALRNLVRNRLYAAINIVGLAVGFAAALLIALYVRDELSYDKWIPGYDRRFLVTFDLTRPGIAPSYGDTTQPFLASFMKLDFPSIQSIARLSSETVSLRRDDNENNEQVYWADPDFFSVVPLPAIAGDLDAALQDPDGIILTQKMARKYFGSENAIGGIIELNRQHVMHVVAILKDLPSNTHLNTEIFASGRASYSGLTRIDAAGLKRGLLYTYFSLKPGAHIADIQDAMLAFYDRHNPGVLANDTGSKFWFPLLSLSDIHLSPGTGDLMKPRGSLQTLYSVGTIGLLIVTVAVINFVNLMTARASRRAVEIGVRKVSGAQRRDLIFQFIGESLIYAAFGMALSVALAEFLLLPQLNAFLTRAVTFSPWHEPSLVGAIIGFVLIVGILAGVYPAFVLSQFRPASVLKSGLTQGKESGRVRQGLVVLQFAILIGIVFTTATVYRQMRFALSQNMRFNANQVLLIATDCSTAFKDRVTGLSGVQATACSSSNALNFSQFSTVTARPGGPNFQFTRAPVDFGFFELYGLRPVAGRFFSQSYGGDAAITDASGTFVAPLVLNETAVRQLGFESPQAAVGQTINYMDRKAQTAPHEIIGVVPDFAVDAVHDVIPPTVYFVNPAESKYMSVKISGTGIPETLTAIDRLWKESGEPRPITRLFLDQRVQELYLDISRQAEIFTLFACVAIFIAALGLFGLAAFTAERRTKEIGIRKAMGASRADVLRLLLWQFAKPVLWANLIAWPVAGYLMNRWLHGFAYHVDLDPLVFVGASAIALIIALATVAGHALLVARAKPVAALRYE